MILHPQTPSHSQKPHLKPQDGETHRSQFCHHLLTFLSFGQQYFSAVRRLFMDLTCVFHFIVSSLSGNTSLFPLFLLICLAMLIPCSSVLTLSSGLLYTVTFQPLSSSIVTLSSSSISSLSCHHFHDSRTSPCLKQHVPHPFLPKPLTLCFSPQPLTLLASLSQPFIVFFLKLFSLSPPSRLPTFFRTIFFLAVDNV